ncbi:hypothetical protein HY631_02640 [Candidatus Uhrbacteria bacterium]|nr:hypothetical protein [Candidatus Uhrbacteria bacterium]
MSEPERPEPTEEEFIALQMSFARARAKVDYDMRYGHPRRARETAGAWLGTIQLSTMGGKDGYTSGTFGRPYEPPKTAVAPAAPELQMKAGHFHVSLVKAGEDFHVLDEHLGFVQGMVGEATFKADPRQRRTQIATFAEDFVCVTWHAMGRLIPEPSDPVPTNFRLWKPTDRREHEIVCLTGSLLCLHETEAAAKQWTARRAGELQAQHDRNHARQCRDKACARRGHAWQLRHDED